MKSAHDTLQIKFHGRIIDHLGIQMYQSPTAALAELISNSWDADAEEVRVTLPSALGEGSTIVIDDNGTGMTFSECQDRYLNVGYARRGNNPAQRSAEKGRPILGRKGIGKFAGFGIAKIIRVETISKETGEKTVFELDIDQLRSDEYVAEGGNIPVVEYLDPDEDRKREHGTKITLKSLTVLRRPAHARFVQSMARRFTLHERVADFQVVIDGELLPKKEEGSRIQFVFPRDYTESERPINLIVNDDWGTELLNNGRQIKWQVSFYERPISDEELQGISIFSRGKLAQAPFFFNLAGGLGGQHGQEYLSGRVEADYLDELEIDLIAPERQRINWQHPETEPLLEWGQDRIKSLLRIWQRRRVEEKVTLIERRVDLSFSPRLLRLPTHEQKIVREALKKLAGVASIDNEEFEEMGEGILLAWEGGRLKELINAVASTESMSEVELVKILVEARVLTALHTAEAVKAKLLVIAGLHERVRNRDLENAVRDYIAKDPWLISPRWELYQKEVRVTHLIKEAAKEAKLDEIEDWEGRVDLALSSGDTLLIVEFMRPGLRVDWNHIERFDQYITALRVKLKAITGANFNTIVGYLVADKLEKSPMVIDRLERMAKDGMFAIDWETLLRQASAQWREFFIVLAARAPEDDRLVSLCHDLNIEIPVASREDHESAALSEALPTPVIEPSAPSSSTES
jgi:Histidine kinase-, DNA gyrase B-, and HSP90-like ATPase